MTIDQLKDASIGNWESIAVEVRPGNTKNADGTLKPFYLTRNFTFSPGDKFELVIANYSDPFGKMRLAKMFIKGHIQWRGEYPIETRAQKVDFAADEEYTVTYNINFIVGTSCPTKSYLLCSVVIVS